MYPSGAYLTNKLLALRPGELEGVRASCLASAEKQGITHEYATEVLRAVDSLIARKELADAQ